MHAPCTNTIVFLLPHPPSSPSLPPPPLTLITNHRSLSQLALPIPAPAFLTGFSATGPARAATSAALAVADGGLDLRETIRDGARVLLMDPGLRRQLLLAFTQDSRLHVKEVMDLYRLVADDLPTDDLVGDIVEGIPSIGRDLLLSWSDSILERR
ncbi:unnamed protein product [Closterium sp. NIES-53]